MPSAPPTKPPKAPPPTKATQPRKVTSSVSLSIPNSTVAPPRIVLNAVEGWGKTSCGAYAPDPAMLMASGETGYLTLLGVDRVPKAPSANLASWSDVLGILDSLIDDPQGRKTLVLDAMGGFERLCHAEVCRRDFNGDWGEKGFMSFHKGYHMAVNDWLQLLQRLDAIREAHGMTVLILSHALIKSFKNPMGSDFDRYVADVHEKIWGVTHKWSDAVLFGTFYTVVDEKRGSAPKGIGGTDRVVYCERRDAFDAKNRYGLPEMIQIPDSPSKTWNTIHNAITGEAT